MKKPEPIYPFPGLIEPGKWDITPPLPINPMHGGAPVCSSREDREMHVPLTEGKKPQFLRRHEMAHVAISPASPVSALKKIPHLKRPSMESLLAAEDRRIEQLMARLGYYKDAEAPAVPTARIAELVTKMWEGGDQINAARLYCASYYQLRLSADAGIPEQLREYFRWAPRQLHSPNTTRAGFKDAVRIARWLDKSFLNTPPRLKDEQTEGSKEAVWMVPRIINPPRPDRAPRDISYVNANEGCELLDISRMPVDRKVFARPIVDGGDGAVLVDCSGSMGFTAEQLKEILLKRPEATVACYGAFPPDDAQLIIVARDGKIAREEAWQGIPGGNLCDAPALEWLAKQPGPRTWLSDGRVTMLSNGDEDYSVRAQVDCDRICARANIRRIDPREGGF